MEIIIGCKVAWKVELVYSNVTIIEVKEGIVKSLVFDFALVQQPGRTELTPVKVSKLERLMEPSP